MKKLLPYVIAALLPSYAQANENCQQYFDKATNARMVLYQNNGQSREDLPSIIRSTAQTQSLAYFILYETCEDQTNTQARIDTILQEFALSNNLTPLLVLDKFEKSLPREEQIAFSQSTPVQHLKQMYQQTSAIAYSK